MFLGIIVLCTIDVEPSIQDCNVYASVPLIYETQELCYMDAMSYVSDPTFIAGAIENNLYPYNVLCVNTLLERHQDLGDPT